MGISHSTRGQAVIITMSRSPANSSCSSVGEASLGSLLMRNFNSLRVRQADASPGRRDYNTRDI